MAPTQIAVIPNPILTKSHLHLKYTISPNAQLSFEIRDSNDRIKYMPYKDNGTVEGAANDPGSLAAVMQNYIPVVYGIASDSKQRRCICKLSPYYNPLAQQNEVFLASGNGLAACGDGQETNLVYFVNDVGTKSDPRIALIELQVTGDQATPTVFDALPYKPDAGTYLTAFFHESPFVFYTDTSRREKGIYHFNPTAPRTVQLVLNTAGISPQTPLAVATSPSKNEKNNAFRLLVAVYFMNDNGYLARATGRLDEGSITWSSTTQSLQNIQLDQTTSLAVVNNATAINTVYVYYIPDGRPASDYRIVVDNPWLKDIAG
ncbi:hypothetical protein EYZ11_010276 [Aspergillus tanneri]|uniref:Fucose-specific lectin n=1 Tax=Aspergillus tanneri TaxID=1220188 RepID=A0A4S3J7X0_9EURO|nr:hypothetical protein EYZ11_010276 [Aspergillus tanneri]